MRIISKRDLVVWGAVPAALVASAVALFIVPNYVRAAQMQNDADSISVVADEYMIQRGEFELLRRNVEQLQSERVKLHKFAKNADESTLFARISRRVDGRSVRDQSVQTELPEVMDPVEGRPLPLARRTMRVQMQGTFETVFGVLHDIESSNSTERITKVDIASAGNGLVEARIELEEWMSSEGGEL